MSIIVLILGALALLALLLMFALGGLIYWAMTADFPVEKIQPLIPSHKNLDIVGDGAWISTPAKFPARIRDLPEQMGW